MLYKLMKKQEETGRSVVKIEKRASNYTPAPAPIVHLWWCSVCYALRLRLLEFADRPEVFRQMAQRVFEDAEEKSGDPRGVADWIVPCIVSTPKSGAPTSRARTGTGSCIVISCFQNPKVTRYSVVKRYGSDRQDQRHIVIIFSREKPYISSSCSYLWTRQLHYFQCDQYKLQSSFCSWFTWASSLW